MSFLSALQILGWLSLLSLFQCGPPPSSLTLDGSGPGFFSDCLVPTDQSRTLTGSWPAFPIPVTLSSHPTYGQFTNSEKVAITNAIQTWNTFFQNSKAFQLFYFNPQGSADAPPFSQLCNQTGKLQNNQFVSPIVIYKILQNWPYASQAIAITDSCHTQVGASPLPRTYTAAMYLNALSFFNAGRQNPSNLVPDLQSIVLHELGHLLGLDHSCGAQSGFPSCGINLNPLYREASLYPIFNFYQDGRGEIRQDLKQNDEERSNCLYPWPPNP